MSIECLSKDCQDCLHDPDSECATTHPYVWMKIYDPLLDNCNKQKKNTSCENLELLLKTMIRKNTSSSSLSSRSSD